MDKDLVNHDRVGIRGNTSTSLVWLSQVRKRRVCGCALSEQRKVSASGPLNLTSLLLKHSLPRNLYGSSFPSFSCQLKCHFIHEAFQDPPTNNKISTTSLLYNFLTLLFFFLHHVFYQLIIRTFTFYIFLPYSSLK